MYRNPDGRYLILGITGLFSIGYYVLPVLLMKLSELSVQTNVDVMVILMINTLYFIFVFAGYILFTEHFRKNTRFSINFYFFDYVLKNLPATIFFIGYAIWLMYFLRGGLTSYGSDDIEVYFHNRDKLEGLLAALASYSLSLMTITIIICYLQNRSIYIFMSVLYVSCVFMLLTTAQRLAVITPIFVLIATLSVFNYQKTGNKIIFIAVLFLFLTSPLMVFVREFQGVTGYNKFFIASSNFSYGGEDILDNLVASILGRADLLNVSVYLKNYIDTNGYVGGMYYLSILSSFVPKFLWADKPYPLSDDGTIWGEISVLAWQLIKGNSTGSLSAFGAISAYREGGWWWLPINGFLTGTTLSGLYFMLTRSGLFGRFIYASIIIVASVRNVPPSFFQLLVFLAAPINVMLIAYLIDKYFSLFVIHFKKRTILNVYK